MADKITYEHYVAECFIKCAHVILGSRIYRESRTVSDRRTRKWFLLEIDELESAAAELDTWRRDIHTPLVLEVVYYPWGKPDNAGSGEEPGSTAGEMLLERWVLQYSKAPPGPNPGSLHRSIVDEAAVYKRMIILIRSLYSYTRMLPAYRIYRAICKRQGQAPGQGLPALDYRISRGLTRAPRGAPSRMQQFAFAPIDTPSGCFRLAVDYQPSSTVQILEQTAAPIMSSPQIISDYIGSAALGGGRALRAAMSTSVYETRPPRSHLPDPSSSPPISTGAGILRGMHPRTMLPVHRQSWSSRDQPSHAVSSSLRTPVKRSVSGHMAYSHSPGASPQSASASAHSPLPLRPVAIGSVPPGAVVHGFAPPEGSMQQQAASPVAAAIPFSTSGQQGGQQMAAAAASASLASAFADPLDLGEEEGEEGGAPPGSASATSSSSSVARQASAPMKIPGRGHKAKSAANLHQLEGEDAVPVPDAATASAVLGASAMAMEASQRAQAPWRLASTSAPAAARGMLSTLLPKHSMLPPGQDPAAAAAATAVAVRQLGGGGPGGPSGPGQPRYSERPAGLPFPPSHSSSSSSLSSAFHMSCSPQLPFAMTPAAQSLGLLGSFADHQATLAALGAPASLPSPPVSGRDITPLAVISRPSWSSRSSSFDPAAMPSVLSISPLQDLMDTGLLSGSTPQQQIFQYSPASSPCLRLLGTRLPRDHAPFPIPLELAAANQEQEPAITAEESESDLLPFALDGDGLPGADSQMRAPTVPSASSPGAAGEERDVAIGAFIRMVKDAPPLLGGPLAEASLTMGQALNLLSEKMAHIQAVLGPEDAQARQ